MLTCDDRPMLWHQSVGSPTGLKYGFMHGPTAAGSPRIPHLSILDPLQRFMRTQEQARHIPTDMVKALSTAQHLPIGSHTTTDRLGHTNKRHHGYPPGSGGSLLRGLGARFAGKTRPRTVVGTRVDASPSSRRCREGLRNIVYYINDFT